MSQRRGLSILGSVGRVLLNQGCLFGGPALLLQHQASLSFQAKGSPSISADDRALWEKLFTDIRNFDDYRAYNAATGSKGPDFRHKDSGDGLWLGGKFPRPADMLKRIASLPPPSPNQGGPMRTETRALWELMFLDRSQFDDFRQYKADRGGNGPDFRHTESGEGLWLTGKFSIATDIAKRAAALPFQASMSARQRALWELLFSDFSQFEDYRRYKAESGSNGPDFKHKETDKGLWISSKFPVPADILARVAALPPPSKNQAGPVSAKTRACWELLFSDPSQFEDRRAIKAMTGGNGSDFQHLESGKGLWLKGNYALPADIVSRAEVLYPSGPSQGAVSQTVKHALWEQLFSDSSQFEDLRAVKAKIGGNGPDFKHKRGGEGLWMASKYPLPLGLAQRIAALPPPRPSKVA